MPTEPILYFLAGVIAIILLMLPWKITFWLAFVILIVEGVIRAWIIPQQEMLAFFLKDALLGIAYTRFIIDFFLGQIPRKQFYYPLIPLILITLLTIWVTIQTANMRVPDAILAIFGARTYLYYLPILFLVPYLFNSKKELYRAFTLFSLSMIPIGTLGILQFFGPTEPGTENIFLTYLDPDKVAFVGIENVYSRITGTFPYITPYEIYLFFTAMITIFLLWIRPYRNIGIHIALMLALAFITINAFMTGSRSVVFSVSIAILLFLILTIAREGATHIHRSMNIVAPFFILFIVFLVWPQLREAPSAFIERTNTAMDAQTRFTRPLIMPLILSTVHAPFGIGAGTTHQAAGRIIEGYDFNSLIPRTGGPYDTWFEEEPAKIGIELGFPGLIIVYALHLSFFLLFLGWFITGANPDMRILGLMGMIIIAGLTAQGVIFNSTSYMLYLLCAGILSIYYIFENPLEDELVQK